MPAFKQSGAVTGAAIGGTGPVALRSVLVTAGAAAATATIKGAGTTEIVVTCPANDTRVYPATSGGNQFSLEQIPGPVTLDVTGTGAFVRVSY